MEYGGRGIGAPVHGVDADVGACNEGQHILHVLYGVVTDGDARVGLALGGADVATRGHVGLGHLVAQHVGGGQLAVGLVVDVLQQFHHGQTALAEACEDERARLVTLRLKEVEGRAHVIHRQTGTLIDGVLAVGHERLDGRVAIERRIEAVAGRHIGRHLLHLQVSHVGAVLWVPHVGVVAYLTIRSRPVVLPRRNNVEHVGSRAVRVAVCRNPHRGVAIVRSLWDIPALYRLPRRIIVVRRTRCKRRRTADCEYEGYQPKSCSFHILVLLL